MISRRKFSAFALASSAQLVAPGLLLAGGGERPLPDNPASKAETAVQDFSSQIRQTDASGLGDVDGVFPGVPFEKTYEKAIELLGSHFDILLGETGLISVELVSVTDIEYRFHTDAFYLVFNTSWTPVLDEGLYTFDRAGMGRFRLFLQPSTEQPHKGSSYTVLVNRLVQEPI